MANQIKYKVGFDVDNKSLKSLQQQLLQIQKMSSKDFMKINPKSLLAAEQELKQIQKTARQVDEALEKAFNPKLNTLNLGRFKQELGKLGVDKIYSDFSKMGATGQAAFKNLSAQMMTVNTHIRQSHSLIDKMATTLGNTLKWNIASNAINGMTRSIDQAWGYVKSLDGSLNDIRIVTGKSSDEMARFAVQANNAAKQLGKTTTDYTKASLIYAQQGLSDEEIEARARITLKAANVTGQSTDAVSEELTAVWNGYKVTAEEAELYVDRLAAIAAHTASNLEELSTGMSKVASAAAAMGVGEDQLAAQLSTIISVTRQAPESVGTALRTVYARISDIKAGIDEDGVTLGNYSSKMAALGFNVLDTAGNLRDMGEVMEEIGNKWQFLTREQQVNLAQTMAGQRQYSNLIALFDNFSEYNRALNIAQNAAGTLQEQQDIYMESTVAHLNQLKASVEDVYDSFMNRDSLDSVNDLIDVLSEGATIIARFIDSLGGGMNILSSLGALGVTVFSKQIANGIQTTIHNLQIGKQQAQEFAQAIENAKTLKAANQIINPGDRTYAEQLEQQTRGLNLGQKINREDFDSIQKDFLAISKTSGEVDILNEKIRLLDSSYQRLGGSIKNNYQDMIQSEEGITNLQIKIQTLKTSYESAKTDIDKLSNSMKKLTDEAKNLTSKKDAMDFKKSFDVVRQDFSKALTDMKAMKGESGNLIFDSFSQGTKNTINNIQEQLTKGLGKNFSNWSVTQAQGFATQMSSLLVQVRLQLQREINEMDQLIKKADEGTRAELEQKKAEKQKALSDLKKSLGNKLDDAQTNVRIQQYTQLAGGIAQVGFAIQQVQNLGSIWTNDDLSPAQKLLQTITNLAMVIPQFVMGFKSITDAIKVFTTTEEIATAATTATAGAEGVQAVTAQAAAAAEGERTATTTAAATASGAAAATTEGLVVAEGQEAVTANNAAAAEGKRAAALLLSNGVVLAAIIGVTAIVAAIAIYIGHLKELHKQTIENAKADIEEANKKQQLINKNKELYDSVEQLNNQYQNGEITRAELRNSIQGLIEQYGIENEHIISLITQYDNLTEAIQRLKAEAADEMLASTRSEAQDVEDLLIEQAKDNGQIYGKGDNKKFATTISAEGLNKESLQIIKDMGGVLDAQNMTYTITVDANTQSLVNLQEKMTEMKQTYQDVDAAQRASNAAYNDIADYISGMSQAANAATANMKELNNAIAGVAGKDQDFSNIDSFAKYQQARQAMIDKVKGEKGFSGDETDAALSVDNYLSQNQMDLFNQFDEPIQKLDEFKEKFGESNQQVEKFVKNLSKDDLDKFVQLNPDIITDWDQLLYILQHISEIDLENTTKIGDIQARNKENLDNFKKYDEVREKVSQGKEIKDQDYGVLPQQLKQFFTYAGDGMYKLAENAKGFYDAIDDLKLQGFQDTIQAIQGEIQNLQQVAQGDSSGKAFNYNELKQSAYKGYGGYGTGDIIDQDLARTQLQYLDAATVKGSELNTLVQQLLEKETLGKDEIAKIDQLINQVGDKTKDIDGNLEGLNGNLKQQYQQIHDAMFPTDEDVDTKKLQALSDQLQELATQSDALADSLQSDGRTAEDVAQALLRFSDATKDVADNYDDWMKALSSGSLGDQAEAIAGLRDAYADLLDFPEDAFSDQFLTSAQNLQLLKEAANGSEEAYNSLMQTAQQDIAAQVGLDTAQFDAGFDHLMDLYYQGQNIEDMQIGASLNDQGFLDGLTNMVNAAGMTAQQATAYLASMGVDAQIIEQDTEAEEESEAASFYPKASQPTQLPYSIPFGNGMLVDTLDGKGFVTGVEYVPDPTSIKTKKQNKAFSLKVTSAHKSSGGGFKYSNAPGKKSSGGKGSGGGGGGGGGGGSKPDTSKKDKKKPIKTQKDPYHDINIQLQKINRQLERVQDKQERLYGKQLIDNLNKQNQLLEQQKKKLLEKSKIQKKDLEDQRKALKQMGATFDKQGNLTNYSDLISQRQAEIQAMYNQYNKSIQKYNNSTDADYKKALSQSLSQYDKQIKEKEDSLKELTSAISKYDKTREQFEDNLDEIEEATQKQIENNIKKFNMQLEIRLDMGKAERDWNKFKRDVLEKTDVLKSSNFDKIFGDAKQNFEDLFSYFNVHGSIGSIETLTNQLNATKQQIEQIDKTGTSAIYGDNKAQAMEDLQKNLDELMDQMQDIEELIDNIDQAYLDTIDDIQEGFDEQIESYEYVQDLLKSDLDLLQLLYGDKNYDAMNSYYEQLQQNNNKQLDSLKRQREFWKEQWNEAVAKGDTNAAKKFEQNYKNTISNLNQLIQDSVENLQNKYSNAVEQIFDALDKKLTSGKGSDYLQESWDLMTKNADQYLDAVNSAFAIQSTQRKYQNALNETKSIKNQQALKDLMDQQLKILKNKDKLTQYDVDRAQKLLEVEQARIALEDARSAKTSMRLKRDSQGNYSYEYMADEEGINEAEQNYANAQNDLYNFDLDKTNQTTGEILTAWNEFKDRYKEIMLDVSLSDEERHERLKLLQDQWGQYFNLKTEQLIGSRENLMESAFGNFASLYELDVQNYKDMADAEKEILMSDIVPTWNNGIVAMATKMAGEGGLLPVCKEAFLDLDSTTQNYKKDLDELASAADINFDDIKNGIDNDVLAFSELIQANDELIQKMSNQLQSIKLLKTAADELKQQYKETTNAAKDMVTQIHNFIQAQQAQAADYIANQQSMANAYAEARAKEADAYVAAVNRIVAAIKAANSGSGSSPSGSGPGGTNPGNNNNSTKNASNDYGYDGPSYEANAIWDEIHRGAHAATGMYTGDWHSNEGRIAVLHEKELVLNKEDTKNILDAVQIIRALNDSVLGKAYDINSGLSLSKNSQDNQQTLEQNVYITASFPNVDSKKQIKEAFSELTNLAAQRAMRR